MFVLIAACSSANESGLSSQGTSSEATDSTVTPITAAISATSTTVSNVAVLLDSDDPTLALDHTENAPALDAFAPSVMPDTPMGRVGYTRYVFTQSGDQIIPALIEGPKASQTRCQTVELPCSFQDLKDLFESGAAVPEELNMTSVELGLLVDQLGAVESTIRRFEDVNDACAAGYFPDGTQTPNMGSHFTNFPLIVDGKFST